MKLLYVMDPMCGWCYGFQPELEAFLKRYPLAEVDWIMGGLAPDTDQPMDENLKATISAYWYQIETKCRVNFNHDFWRLNTPYRSTYSACRAVISAESLKEKSAPQMVKAIQSAYYLEAKNPALNETLLACARLIEIDEDAFRAEFASEETEQKLQQHIQLSRHLQVSGFPALFYIDSQHQAFPLTLGYCDVNNLELQLKNIEQLAE